MNILDEYWTRDVPTEPGQYAVLHTDGCLEICDLDRARNIHGWPWGAGFCRLAPAAEVDRLKAENAKLREALRGLICICEREINMEQASRDIDAARAAIEGRSE